MIDDVFVFDLAVRLHDMSGATCSPASRGRGGWCAGCPGKPGCHEGLVIPALLAVPGVRDVQAPGTRTDPAARARLQAVIREGPP